MRRRRSSDLVTFKTDVDRQDAVGMSLLVAVEELPKGLDALEQFASAIAARMI
jgi:hypothetical protein